MELIGNILSQSFTPLTPDDLGYWIGWRRSGSLCLEVQLLALLATIILIIWKYDEMNTWPKVVAGVFALALVIAFLWVGYHLPKIDARGICLFLNFGQLLVFVCLIIHRQVKQMNWF